MDKNCFNCSHNERDNVGGETVCYCTKTGAYIGSEAMKEHWCRHWEDYRNEKRESEDAE